jgi:hypothetical protein
MFWDIIVVPHQTAMRKRLRVKLATRVQGNGFYEIEILTAYMKFPR